MTKIIVGSKVKCLDDKFIDLEGNPFKISEIILPKESREYTVREIYTNENGTGIILNEIKNPTHFYGPKVGFFEPMFGIHRFIPIVKT